MASSSSSSSSLWKFDVFLSFRGADTRRTFVSFLYKELDRKGIKTFKDDEELERGEYISPALLQAIEESKFAVVVLSENYASSGWCLEELVKIMECHESGMLTAIPIFYEVEPSDVRRRIGKFAQHMKKHEGRENPEKAQSWSDALTKVANLSGECSQNWKDNSELIDKFVNHVSDRLISTTLSDFSSLVGMAVRMKAVSELLDLECDNEVRMIGIWGMGGIGKTTLARYVCEQISQYFQTHCFLENIKKIYRDGGSSGLQEKLLSGNHGGAPTIKSSYVGCNVIKSRLGHLKVLLVVDDVDKIEQLDAIAKDSSWFGPGSRVIVTTRDKHLLAAYQVKHVYEVQCLEYSEALQLFRQSAFTLEDSFTGFERLSDRAVELAGGLPLALKVFGSNLRSRRKEDWEVILSRLTRSPNDDVVEILKVSYDGLNLQQKFIFLCIACLFDGENVHHVTRLLNDDGVQNTDLVIRVLVEKSLVAVSRNGSIIMHDAVKQVGRELARQQYTDEPRKRQILWESDEIHDILTDGSGTKAIEGISLDTAEVNKLTINREAFGKMLNLKFLKIHNSGFDGETKVSLPPGDTLITPKLKYLRWDRYPSKTLQFSAESLVQLDMRDSKLEKLWKDSPCLRNLKKIDLSWSFNLKEFPNLSNAPNLEEIIAGHCKSLTEIPASINSLKKLIRLRLDFCIQLQRLPSNMDLESLETVHLHGCPNLKIFPQSSRGIEEIGLIGGTQRELSESIGYLSHLIRLQLCGFEFLESLPDTIGNLTTLQDLRFDGCHRLERIPETIGDLTSLQVFELNECPRLQRIPETIQKLKNLKRFWVSNCKRITEFPYFPENVTEVYLNGTSIQEIPSWTGDLCYLDGLGISHNERLKYLSASIYNLKRP